MPLFVILASFSILLPTSHCIPKLKLLEGSTGGDRSRNLFWQGLFEGEGIQRPYVTEITPDVSLCLYLYLCLFVLCLFVSGSRSIFGQGLFEGEGI